MIAFLLWLHRRSSEPAPTSVKCYWKKSKLSQVGSSIKIMPLADMSKRSQKPRNFPSADNFVDRVIEEIAKRKSNFQLTRHCISAQNPLLKLPMHQIFLKYRNQITSIKDLLEFAQKEMPPSLCRQVMLETIGQTESKLWPEMRYGRITASIIYAMAHCKTEDGSLVDLILGASKIKDNDAMRRGRRLEKQVLEVVQAILKVPLESSGLFLNPQFPALGASPDALGPDFVVEIKCPTSAKTTSNYISTNNTIGKAYLGQIQLQMLMTCKKRGYFCVAAHDFEQTKKVRVFTVNFNKQFILNLVEKSMEFWGKSVFPKLQNSVS